MNLFNKALNWDSLAEKAIHFSNLTLEEGTAVLEADDVEILPIMQAAFQVRHHFYGKK